MAKGFRKFLTFAAIASAACAGVYYFLNNESDECECCSKNKSDSQASDEDTKESVMDSFFKKSDSEKEREYVALKPQPKAEVPLAHKTVSEEAKAESEEKACDNTTDNTENINVEATNKEATNVEATDKEAADKEATDKEAIKEVVAKACEEIIEKQAEAADNVGIVKDNTEASDFAFKKFEEALEE